MWKEMLKIYWSSGFRYNNENKIYTFKFYLHNFLVVSTTQEIVKGGNKRGSAEISISGTFMISTIYSITHDPFKKPELNLWDEYLDSFQISERVLLRWINKIIDNKGSNINIYQVKDLEKLRNKIKD